jgi:hypothetical protein
VTVLSHSDEFRGTARYRIVRCLGEGGMGVVYEVEDRETGRRLALKTVRGLGGEDLLRLKNEFRAQHDLHHPNLVRLGDLAEEHGRWFFTMELVDGTNLVDFVRPWRNSAGLADRTAAADVLPGAPTERDPLSGTRPRPRFESARTCDVDRLRASLRQLADGLHALHQAGKVHRDIKPSNVLVTAQGRVVILDLGLVTEAAPEQQSGVIHVLGTVDYMAPEQAAGQPVGPAADWYSVGVVLYEALTGHVPYAGQPLEVIAAKQSVPPVAPGAVVPDVPADLAGLCMELLRADPEARPGGAEVLLRLGVEPSGAIPLRSRAAKSPKVAFVGRAPELLALLDAFEATRRGRATAVLVRGESGVGKSALVREFTAKLEREGMGAVVLGGRCYEREAVPYKAFDGVVDALARYLGALDDADAASLLPRGAALLGEVFPVLRQVKAVARAPRTFTEAQVEPQALRVRLFAALRELFGRLVDRRPLVVVVDDLQWADADSLLLLAELLRPPEEPPFLFVATTRATETTGNTSEILGAGDNLPGHVRSLDVGRLPPDEARTLAEVLLQEVRAAQTGNAADVAREADGHPLFIQLLARHLQARVDIPTQPLRLDQMLRRLVADLPPGARRVLELAAVAGTRLAADVVARAAALSAEEVERALGTLAERHLIQAASGLTQVYHDRIRESVLLELGSEAIRQRHLELALALEVTRAADPDSLAAHWLGAGDPGRAAKYAVRAAPEAEAVLAFDRAARLYRMALADPGLAAEPRRQLETKLGDVLVNAGRGTEAAEVYLRTARTAPPSVGRELQRRAAAQLLRSGHIEQGLTVSRELLADIGMALASTPRRALLSALLRRARLRLRGLRFTKRSEGAIAPQELERVDICWSLGSTLGTTDNIYGVDYSTRTLLLALKAGEPHRIAHALVVEAVYASFGGPRAARRSHRLFKLLEGLGGHIDAPWYLGWLEGCRGIVAYYEGNFIGAREPLARAEEVVLDRCTGMAWELGTIRMFMLWTLVYLGHVDEVARRVPRLVAEALDRGDLYDATNFRLGLPNQAWLVGDQPDEARRMLEDASMRWSRHGFHVQHWYEMSAGANLLLYTGDGSGAHALMSRRWGPLADSLLVRIQMVRVEGNLLRSRCALAAAAADAPDRAGLLKLAERAARRVGREEIPGAGPAARLALAGAYALRDDPAAAVPHLEAAVAGFDAVGMALHAAVARRRLGELLGGSGGQELVAGADSWMSGRGIRNPARWAAMLAPGFEPGD